MRVQHCTDLQTYYDRVAPFLCEREVENNIMLGIMGDLLRQPSVDTSAHYMGYVENEAGEVVAACQYGGYRLLMAKPAPGYEAALTMLLEDVADRSISGLLLPAELDTGVAELWTARTGRRLKLEMAMRAYRLDAVTFPKNVAGTMRWASVDEAFIIDWIIQFYIGTFGHEPDEAALAREKVRFASGSPYKLALWEVNDQHVSMGASIGLSPTGMRIGLVYTPAEHRGHGYASALVAALSQALLDSGLQFCTLNTDIANPTSNKIYQAIGYVPVCDITVYDAEPLEEAQ